jgi:hypothetical protein
MGDSYRSDSSDEPARPGVSADGSERGESDTRQSHLHTVFVNVTGVEECIDKQEETELSRYVDADAASVSAAVTAVAADDGLTDTIDEFGSDERTE